jgi:hypothetical protein
MNAKLILVSLVISSVAAAQSPSVEAEALFRQGKKLMADGKIAEACAAFDSSQKLDPSVSTMLNQAACREKNNQLTTAWGLFVEAERQTRDKTDAKNKSFNKVAKEHADKLEPKLSRLAINVAKPMSGLAIKRNGEDVVSAAWNHPLPIDGGTYTIEASAPDHKPWSTQVTIANESDTKTIDVPALEAAPKSTEPARPLPTPVAAVPAPPPAPAPSHGSSQVVPIIIGVAGVGLLGGGLALELSARSTYDKAKVEPDDAKQTDLWHSANNKRYAAEGLAAAGVAVAGVAVWLFVRGGSSESATTALAPVIDRNGGTLVLTGSL